MADEERRVPEGNGYALIQWIKINHIIRCFRPFTLNKP